MKRLFACRMLDLLPAGNPRGHDDGVRLSFDCGNQTPTANCHGNVVVFFLEAEGTRHSTATRIDFLDSVSQRNRFFQKAGSDQSLLMAVSVNQGFRALSLEAKTPSPFLLLTYDELLKKERRLSNSFNRMA